MVLGRPCGKGLPPPAPVPAAPFQTVLVDNHEVTEFGEDVHTHPVTQRKDKSRPPITPKLGLEEERAGQVAESLDSLPEEADERPSWRGAERNPCLGGSQAWLQR